MQALLSGSFTYNQLSPSTSDAQFPRSASSSGPIIDYAISKWFGLLAGDAELENGASINDQGQTTYGLGSMLVPNGDGAADVSAEQYDAAAVYDSNVLGTYPGQGSIDGTNPRTLDSEAWQSRDVLKLHDREHFIFQNFVHRVSHWVLLSQRDNLTILTVGRLIFLIP